MVREPVLDMRLVSPRVIVNCWHKLDAFYLWQNSDPEAGRISEKEEVLMHRSVPVPMHGSVCTLCAWKQTEENDSHKGSGK